MKKIKLFTSLVGISTITTLLIPTISSCSNTSHIKIDLTDKEKTTKDGSAYYFIALDNDKYESNEFSVKLISRSNADINDLTSGCVASGNILVVKLSATKAYAQDTTYNFDLEVKSKTWTNKLDDFKLTVPADLFDGQVTQAQWEGAINKLTSANANFSASGTYKYVSPDPEKSKEYTFTNKYDKDQSKQDVVNHTWLGTRTLYMDKKYDMYWTYMKINDQWKASDPFVERFGADDFYYFVSMLDDLKDMATSGMKFISSEVGGIGYYYGSIQYEGWTIEYGLKFNKDKVINKTEIRATKGEEIKDTVATYSDYGSTEFVIPSELESAQFDDLKEMEYSTTYSKFSVWSGHLPQGYFCMPLKYTSEMPASTTINSIKGTIPTPSGPIKLDIIDAYVFVNGKKYQATIDPTTKVATFPEPITITKDGSDEITFALYFDSSRNGAQIELN